MAERDDRGGAADVGAEAALAETLSERDGAHPTLTRGTTIHRYAVLEQVGSGAMGVVYAAYDAGLDRRIALKVLRDPRRGGAHRRLVREAKALAKLSHPGVIAVYDVGTYRDQVFVAMEFVAGRTVRAWLGEAPRSWREVVDVYVRAGEGLAAAHAAGIVHRDFKPDNVLIDEAGRVRVGDFGLALVERAEAEAGDDARGAAAGEGEASPDELTATRAGAAVGTPAYMAPEQRTATGPVDARADQYSFCVALHEALYGYRPLAAGSEPEPASEPAPGESEVEPERDRQVPARIRRAIQRGLSSSPDRRHPSMDALLAEVARDPAAARRRVVIGALAVLVAGAVGAWLLARDGEPLCRGAAGKLAGVWDPARKQAVAAAFRRSGAADPARAWAAVEPQLDGYARRWTAMHTDSCEATHVRAEQPADLLDLRTQCLDRRLYELRALTDLFLSADAATVARAAEAAGSLRSLDECADAQALRRVVAPPADSRAVVERLRARLAEVVALHATAKWKRGLEQARGLVADARELGYRPLEAEALVMLGILLRRTDQLAEAEEVIYDAIAAGEAGRSAGTTADAWLELVWLVGAERGRHAEGLRLANLARGVIEQLDGNRRQEAALARHVGHLHVNLGKLDKARPYLARALAMYTELYGSDHVLVAECLQHIGILEQKMGRLDEALRLYRRAHQIAERKLGPEHPATLSYMGEEGSVMIDLGQYAEGLAILERSLAPLERATGPRSGDVLLIVTAIGAARRYTEDYDGARTALERALVLARELYGPEHVQVAKIQVQLGRVFTDTERWAPAREQLDSALTLLRAAFGPDHPDVVDVIEDIARVDIESGHPERAIAPLESALAVRIRTPGDPYRAAFCRFELARALHRSGKPAARVRPLVEAAWRGFVEAGDATSAADMKRWLDSPGFVEPE